MVTKIQCIGQSTVCIESEKLRCYFDPCQFEKKKLKKATHIFLSGKIIDTDAISAICSKKTKVYCPPQILAQLDSFSPIPVVPMQKIDEGEVLPAHKADKFIALDRPLYNGYCVLIAEKKYYFAGPTDLIPEMNVIAADVAFLPVDGDTMDVFEAVAATNVICADLFVPIAYAENVQEGLLSCMRFTRKCMYSSDIARKPSELPKLDSNI